MRTQHDDPDRVARAPRAPSTKARAVDAGTLLGGARRRPAEPLGAGEVLQLQRSAGNAAVARRLTGQRSQITVQRSPQSAKLLEKLATPKVGKGQATDVQTQLVNDVDELIIKKEKADSPLLFNLGGVLIDRLPNADTTSYMPSDDKRQRKRDVQSLFNRLAPEGNNPLAPAGPAEFVGLDNVAGARSTGVPFGGEVKNAGLGPMVVENTLKTMLDAGQFEYLRLAGLPNEDWKILVELHYVRARPKEMAGFHKDTEGQSLFVNLNYHVPGHKLRGPEYVLNPPTSDEHDKLIYGTTGTAGTLPKAFTDDLTELRKELPKPKTIESAGTVEGLGYVAFVDEAIHHATPWFGGRYVTPTEFRAYLERNHKTQFDAIANADPQRLATAEREARRAKKKGGYAELFDERDFASWPKDELKKWKKWLAMATVNEDKISKRDRLVRYTRKDFKRTMPGSEFDRMLEDVGSHHTETADREKGGAAGWFAASIPKAGYSAIKPTGKPPLERTASSADLTKNWPEQLAEDVPRKFIRSWVRAVPKALADDLRK